MPFVFPFLSNGKNHPLYGLPLLDNYKKLSDRSDETLDSNGYPKKSYLPFWELILSRGGLDKLILAQKGACDRFKQLGVTFLLKNDKEKTKERIFPFDVIPRLILKKEWEKIKKGLIQRLRALNLFIEDVYHDRRILKQGVVPEELISTSPGFIKQMVGVEVPAKVYAAVCGCDLIRDGDGEFVVLEDNLRIPSGASYMLVARKVLKECSPFFFSFHRPLSIQSYPLFLLETLLDLHPSGSQEEGAAVWTPGPYNSAYFEHAFLANQMGIPLVESRDLLIEEGKLYFGSRKRKKRISVLYRRIEESFLDPSVFRTDSLIGLSGIFELFCKGELNLVNAPGCGVADDKVLYRFVPEIIRYYLGEEPILRNVETYCCLDPKEKNYVLENIERLVVKEANQSGGMGMLIGPLSSSRKREEFKEKIRANPRNYIAQPLISFSKLPCLVDKRIEARRVDLRPFVLLGKEPRVVPGGLTRVALDHNSFIVNSSQGGGSKDCWVIDDEDQR
ncbi:circularly permuted type 2 ATP-grasp protein [Candidatus Methylacidiphilum infernorum]|uniref:Circularly permuted type 2 ATP-grasp protein n=1 Tax=Candidatus Methylacidiphilum infernorum TaxID=511746 RepID=A0ABX7PU97_9BACT|nr:circularly permuted type 2 ATP-grasp protein [Candidatus Methylacidiphilum infernorum]QSR86395.1 circularly permuted type 2 ATP-grasp protein [Candidatus Methylacidiphilum infernorum]